MKKLQTRMLLFILLPTMLFFAGMGVYTSHTVHKMVKEEAEEKLATEGELLASELSLQLENFSVAAHTLSHTYEGIMESTPTPKREDANTMLRQVLKNNPNILTAWMFWDKDAFDGKDQEFINTPGHDQTGRFLPVWSLDPSGSFIVEPFLDYDHGELQQNLDAIFQTGKSALFEPFSYKLNGEDVLITSIVAPIIVNGKTIGMTGVDISLESINNYISTLTFYDTGFAGLLTGVGNVLSHQNIDLIGQNFFDSTAMEGRDDTDEVRNAVLAGEQKRITGYSVALKKEVYRLFTPIRIGNIDTPWSTLLAVPLDEVTKKASEITKTILVTSLVILVLLTTVILLVTRNITQVLRVAVGHGQGIADGDFTGSVPEQFLKRQDELGDLARIFVSVSDNMRALIGRVKESARLVSESASSVDLQTSESTDAANEVTSSIEKVAQSAEVQMQSAEESAKAMGDMAQGVQAVAHAATVVSDTTNSMFDQASNGQQVVQNAVQQMDSIQKGTIETKSVIDQLGLDANKIQDIVSVITTISEQTNLLALNAAIEAARAGEYGKGFAVVADEVRKLADETNHSAGGIQQLVVAIQAVTKKAAQSMDQNERGVNEGIERMQEVEASFEEIIASVELIVKEALELSAVSEEMSAGSEEIAATSEEMASSAEMSYEQTHQVAAASEQQLASMEEIARSSEALKTLANDLNDGLKKFKV